MSYIPDCRTDDAYNYQALRQQDRDFVNGFDCCAEQALVSAFDNLDAWERDGLDVRPSDIEKVVEAFKPFLLNWIEKSRNELITSAIDNAGESAIADNGNAKAIPPNASGKLGTALRDIPTCELVAELRTREGVETTVVEPYDETSVCVSGPAIVLNVTD